MLLILVTLVLSALSRAEDPLRAVLRSPRASVKLYSDYKTAQHLAYTNRAENSMRFRLFLESARHVADYNEDTEDTGHYAINKFSVMTEEERRAYHGLNITGIETEEVGEREREEGITELESRSEPAEDLLWTNTRAVTEVRDQGGCGSCWAFAVVGAIETSYKIGSGVLRRFSEQEILECSYERRDGCKGGYFEGAYAWSTRNGGRLAAARYRPYEGKDGACRAATTRDGMIAMKIVGYKYVDATEEAHVRQLRESAITVSLSVTDKFHSYDGDIMRDATCKPTDRANHAVTIVGFTSEYFLIKNSWGKGWGEQGFARLARNYHNCKLYRYSRVPVLMSTGRSDSGGDPPAMYSEGRSNQCSDLDETFCRTEFDRLGCCGDCSRVVNAPAKLLERIKREYCQNTCRVCERSGCPGGTVKCSDGVCRHRHMCH